MRKNYVIPEDDWYELLKLSCDARQARVMLVGGVDLSTSARQRVQAKWEDVAHKLGFDVNSVRPVNTKERTVSAVPVAVGAEAVKEGGVTMELESMSDARLDEPEQKRESDEDKN